MKKKKESKINEIGNNIVKFLPESVSFVFGDTVTKGVALTSVAVKGLSYLREKNNDFLKKAITREQILEIINDKFKCAEYVQFMREVLKSVAYETQEEKRKYLLNIAKNYDPKHDKITFDRKLLFKNILDNLSVEESIHLLKFYGQIPYDEKESFEVSDLTHKLVGLGLISEDFDNFNKTFSKISEELGDMEKELYDKIYESVEKGSLPNRYAIVGRIKKFDSFFHKPKIQYRFSSLGHKFVDFVCEKPTRTKIKVGKLSDFT